MKAQYLRTQWEGHELVLTVGYGCEGGEQTVTRSFVVNGKNLEEVRQEVRDAGIEMARDRRLKRELDELIQQQNAEE